MYKYFSLLLLLMLIPVLAYSQGMDQGSMDAKYKSVFKGVIDALSSGGNVDKLDDYLTADVMDHDISPMETKKTGIAAVKDVFNNYHKVFPDLKATIHTIAVSGDMLFAHLTFTGTTSEPYMGMPANHKTTMDAVDLVRFRGDKIAEHWGFTSNTDVMKMMPQSEKMGDDKMMNQGMDKK